MIRSIAIQDYKKFVRLIHTNITREEYVSFVNNILNSNHIIVVYEKDNELIATGTLIIEAKLTYNISYLGHIENIFVDEIYRKQGIGKEIVSYLIQYAKNNKCYRTDLACEEHLIPFYRSLGFDKQIYCMSMLNKENFK
jgi:GNAT superfamily N-acetyltransferase